MALYEQPMLKEGTLEGKSIIVTGGGSGLGKSMTRYFLELGAKVLICSRNEEKLKAAASELKEETGGEIVYYPCDVRDYAQVEKTLQAAIDAFGSVNGLVNNAAGNFISPTERLSPRAFDTIVDIVLKGSYYFTLCLGKYWIKEQMPATVLSIVTTYAWTGSAYVVPSACGKAGVLAMTRSLAVEWAKYNIRLNAIAPGPFPTKGAWERLFPPAMAEKLNPLNEIPVRRFGHHQELANLAAYLMSDYSQFIVGEVVTIDGGEWLQGAGEFNQLEQVPQEMWDVIEQQTRKK